MPTYEYLCRSCSHRFETWQKMADEPLTTCPECGGEIRRVLFAAGVVFKGSGFYKTDYNGNAKATTETSGSSENTTTKEANGDTAKAESNTSTNDNKSTSSTTESKSANTTSNTNNSSSKSASPANASSVAK